MILGIQTTNPSPRPTFDFTAKLFSNMKLNWDGHHMPLLAPMLVVPAGGDGADATAANEVSSPLPPPHVPPTHTSYSTPGPSIAAQATLSNEAPQTPTATAAGGAEDFAALTALSLNLDRCINRVTSLENELGVTKKVLGGTVLKLVTRVKRLEGLLQQRKRRLVLFDSKDARHDAAEVPDDTSMPFRLTSTTRRRLRKPFTSSASEHFLENIFAVEDTLPAGEGIHAAAPTNPAGSTSILAGSSMDPTIQASAAAAPSSTIPAADKGKAPMVDDSFPTDLLSEQERILKNLHDYHLGEDLAKKLHAEQEAKFARQQEELAQKADMCLNTHIFDP
nr:hypothetical protein [Tanacetum cinerariifolium]